MPTTRPPYTFRFCIALAGLALLVGSDTASASPYATDDDIPVEQRAEQVAALIDDASSWAPDLFDPAFLAAVPAPQLKALFGRLATVGKLKGVHRTGGSGDLDGRFDVLLGDEMVVPMSLTVGAAPGHAVIGLFFGAVTTAFSDLGSVVDAFDELPGQVGFAAARLTDDGPVWLAERGSTTPLAIGSAFKLFILGELAAQIAEGNRAWSDVLRLDTERMSLPSGKLHTWPEGAPLTLQSLATLMISISDNTATDHLLLELGREDVEARVSAMGHGTPERNRPFLSTREMFAMKFAPGDALCDAYVRLPNETLKRRFLEDVVADLPLLGDDTDPAALAQPNHIDTVEWFASARDLCHAMDALRRAGQVDPVVFDVLTVNPGLAGLADDFDLVGFKGGSETGVICLTLVLRNGDDWYALAATWNDTSNAVDEGAFVGTLSRAGRLLLATDAAR